MLVAQPNLFPMRELVARASERAMSLSDPRQSLPIPTKKGGRLQIVFLYCTQRPVPVLGQLLVAPSHRIAFDAHTGSSDSLESVTAKELGQSHREGENLGYHQPHRGATAEQQALDLKRLYELYDILLPAFAQKSETTKVSATIQNAAIDFSERFERVSEAPLRPYYRSVGSDFFVWLEQIVP